MDAGHLMRLQKEEHLKLKNLWDNYQNPFLNETTITDGNIGVNVYFAGSPNDGRKKQPPYIDLSELTVVMLLEAVGNVLIF